MLAVSVVDSRIAFFAPYVVHSGTWIRDVCWYQVCPPEHLPPAPDIIVVDKRECSAYAKSLGIRFVPYLYQGQSCGEDVSDMDLLASSQYIRVLP